MSVPGAGNPSRVARIATLLALALPVLFFPSGASAVPSMARQTGLECEACHTAYPQLTPFGRQFKLRGYSMGVPKPDDAPLFDKIPIAGLLQVWRTDRALPNAFSAGWLAGYEIQNGT